MTQKRKLDGLLLGAITLVALLHFSPWSTTGQSGNHVTIVSAASFTPAVAPGSIVTAFGAGLALQTQAATSLPLPNSLAGTTVKLTDPNNRIFFPDLFFVSPFQINFLMPVGIDLGTVRVEVFVNNPVVATGTVNVGAVAPALFLASQTEPKAPAGVLLRIPAGSTEQKYEALSKFDAVANKVTGNVIDLGPEGERVFLVLYGTGLRAATPQNTRLLLGSTQVIPQSVSTVAGLAGLEQLNVQIPRSLLPKTTADSLPLELSLIVNGTVSAQGAKVVIKPARSVEDAQLQLNTFAPLPATAGSPLDINGAGFITNAADNQVFLQEGTNEQTLRSFEAQVVSATNSLLRVLVPFGAGSGHAVVSTPRGSKQSAANTITLVTSLSGFVQSTLRQGIANVEVRVRDTNLKARTDANGAFVIGQVPASLPRIDLEIDSSATGLNYPLVKNSLLIQANRDNQLLAIPELKQITGVVITAPTGSANTEQAFSTIAEFAAPGFAPESTEQLQTGELSLVLPPNVVVRCPGGSTNCPLTLTPFERGRTPANLPPGHFSSTIAQLTPFGATLTPGAKLVFPNSDNLPAGSQARLFKFDQTLGRATLGTFIDVGAATVSLDGQRIETATNAITEASYYFVSAVRPVTALTGFVSEADGRPVRRAVVQARGQSVYTGNFGGFVLENVPVLSSNDQVTLEVSFMRPDKTIDRTQRTGVPVKAGMSDPVVPNLVLPARGNNRLPLLIAPDKLSVTAGETRDFEFIANDPDSGQTVIVTPSGPAFASVPGKVGDVFTLRLAPAANAAGKYALNLTASDGQVSFTQSLEITVTAASNNTLNARSQSVITDEDAAKAFTLTGNGPVGQTLSYVVFTAPLHGKLSGTAPNLSYTPDKDFNGLDSFTFKVRSGGVESVVATVFLVVRPVNDAPVLNVSGNLTVNAGETLSLELTATDIDFGQVLTFTGTNLPVGAVILPQSDSSARLLWSPAFTQAGTYAVNLVVTDSGVPARSGTKTITLDGVARWGKTSGPEGAPVAALLVVGATFYAGTPKEVFVSTNNGVSWKVSNKGLGDGFSDIGVNSLAALGTTVFAGTGLGLYRSTDQGENWTRVRTGMVNFGGLATNGTVLFVAQQNDGVFRSLDAGGTWEAVSNGLPLNLDSRITVQAMVFRGQEVFAATHQGVFRISVTGNTWTAVNPVSPGPNKLPLNFAVSSLCLKGSTLFAGAVNDLFAATVFRLNDADQSWTPLKNGLPVDSTIYGLTALGTKLFASVGDYFNFPNGLGVYVSADNGQTWTSARNGLPPPPCYTIIASGNRLLVGNDVGVFSSLNEGQSWEQLSKGMNATYSAGANSIVANKGKLFAGSASGVARSDDGGQSWIPLNSGRSCVSISNVVASGQTIYTSCFGGGVHRLSSDEQTWTRIDKAPVPNNEDIFGLSVDGSVSVISRAVGIYISGDNGATWRPALDSYFCTVKAAGNAILAGTDEGILRSTNLGDNWELVKAGLPNNGNISAGDFSSIGSTIYVSTSSGVYSSTDNGLSWTRFGTANILPRVAIGSTLYALNGGTKVLSTVDNGVQWKSFGVGLEQNRASSLAALGAELFVTTSRGVFRLTNAVQSWTENNTGLSSKFVNVVAGSEGRYFSGTLGNGVFRSADGGGNWTAANGTTPTALPASSNVQALATTATAVFAGLLGQGVYRSTNDGNNWTEINAGLPNNTADPLRNPRNVNALKISGTTLLAATDGGVFRLTNFASNTTWTGPSLNRRVLALAVRGSSIFAGTFDDGVYRSDDQGQTWVRVGQGVGNNLLVLSLGVSADGNSLFAGTEGGVYRSTDNGANWIAVNQNLPARLPVFSFAAVGEKLYAGSVYGVFLSTDNGASWKQLNAGLLDIYVTSLAVNGRQLLAGTRVGGVFTSQLP